MYYTKKGDLVGRMYLKFTVPSLSKDLIVGDSTDDDWVGYKTCVSDAQEFSKSGYDVETIVYKGVTHGFDRHDQSLKYNAYANSFSKCKIRVTKDLVELDEVTGLDWGIR